MFTTSRPQCLLNNKDERCRGDQIVVGSTILDFSTLLPTDEQIATFNNPSTGNTPISSTLDMDEDTYSPPMSAHLLPRPLGSHRPADLVSWFDSLFPDNTPMQSLDAETFAKLQADLQGFSHEDYCEVLLYAALTIKDAQKKFNQTQDPGLTMGIPLVVIPWCEVNEERIQHMSTMVVKSGVLQACKALQKIYVAVYIQNCTLEGERIATERIATYEINRASSDTCEIRAEILYPLEGKFGSVADRDYILSLPDMDRECVLAERANVVLRAQQDLQRRKLYPSGEVTKRKRDSSESGRRADRVNRVIEMYGIPWDTLERISEIDNLNSVYLDRIFGMKVDDNEIERAARRAEEFELQRLMMFVKRSVSSTRDGLEEGHVEIREDDIYHREDELESD